MNTSKSIKKMVIMSLLIATVFICTRLGINFTGTSGGYSHLGNIPLIAVALLLGRKYGAVVGGVGMGMFDLFSEYAVYTPYTFVIRFLMGYIIGYIAYMNNKNGKSTVYNIVAVLIGCIIVLVGYFIAEYMLYSDWAVAVQSIPGNILQLVVGVVGALPLVTILRGNKTINRYLSTLE